MSNQRRLQERLKKANVHIAGISLGANSDNTESIAGEVLKAMNEIETGNAEIIDDFGDD